MKLWFNFCVVLFSVCWGGGGQDNRTGVSTVVADAASNASEAFGKEGGIPKPAFYCSSLGELSCLNSVNCFHCCNKDSGIFNNCDCSIIRSCPDSLSDIQFSVNCTLLMACCENTGKCVTCIIHCIGELAKCW